MGLSIIKSVIWFRVYWIFRLSAKISSVTLIEIDDILNIKQYGLDIKFVAFVCWMVPLK